MLLFKGRTRSGIGLDTLLRSSQTAEVLPNRQYHIHMFHSGRVTLRNCCFLREYMAITSEVHQPFPSASLPGSTPPAATACDTPNLSQKPPQINIHPDNLLEESPMDPTCNVQLPGSSTTTEIVQRVPRAFTNLFNYKKPGLKECSGPIEERRPMGGKEMNNTPELSLV